jgi:serine/threonine-protein kinase
VKPGNILVEESGRTWEVRVGDFGIALRGAGAKNTKGKYTIIATHPVGYSASYAAPEQRANRPARKASDQYSLALVFCSMLEGRVFSSRFEPRRFARLTKPQNDALLRALAESPDARFDSCREFVSALRG